MHKMYLIDVAEATPPQAFNYFDPSATVVS